MTPVYVGKENNQVKFTMEFTAEEFEAAIQKAYLKNRGRITVAGFRKGKAPRKIIEARYGSGIFFDDAIDSLLNEHYSKCLADYNIEPIDRPSVDFEEGVKLEQGKGFKVTVTVDVPPEVQLKEYKGIKAEREIRKLVSAKDQTLLYYEEIAKQIALKPLKKSQLSDFCRQMGELIKSGISILRALEIQGADESITPYEKELYMRLRDRCTNVLWCLSPTVVICTT